ncbi:MAG: type 1 glutamine amidotransferase [Microbacteriaceae bacterium]
MARVLVVEHEANASIGLVGERIAAASVDMELVGPEVGREVPISAHGFDGVIVLGGTPGPTDDDDAAWLPRVRALIADCLEREVPLLGICLGAEMLAVVAGGTVGGVRNGAEIGLCDLSLTESAAGDPLFDGLAGELKALQWHTLEIHDLPAGSVSLCESDRCPNQAFRVGRVAWGTQFHLEGLASTAEEWARDDSDELSTEGLTADGVTAAMRQFEPRLRVIWSTVADRWLALLGTI